MPKHRHDLVGVLIARPAPTGWQHLQLLRSPTDDYLGGHWSLCRGTANPGEKAPAAALREMLEETALVPAEFYSLGALEQFYSLHYDTIFLAPFFAAIVPAHAEPTLNEEHTAHRWVPDGEIEPLLMWPSELPLIQTLRTFVFKDHLTKSVMRVSI